MEKFRSCFISALALLIPLFSSAQLNLEAIFLNGKYYAKNTGAVSFLNRQERYVQLRSSSKGQYLGLFDPHGTMTDSVMLFALPLTEGYMQPRYSGVSMSPGDTYFLLKSNEERLYRRSGAANYFFVGPEMRITPVGNGKLFFPCFNADESRIAYVKYNNLYWYDMRTATEHAVTDDGAWNRTINGKSDWVYEEELVLTQAFEWNPAGDNLAFLKFDESEVKDYPLPQYYGTSYPAFFTYKYPRVGEANAKVSVWVYDIQKDKQTRIGFDDHPHEYIPRLYWNATGTEIWAMLLNRNQDTLRVVAYDLRSKKTRTVYEEFSDTYINLPIAFDVLQDQSVILSSERDGYRHLYHLDAGGKTLQLLTPGNFEVTKYYGVNEADSTIACQTNEGRVAGRVVCRINYRNGKTERIGSEPGTQDADFAPGLHWGIMTHSHAASPYSCRIFSVHDTTSVVIQDNAELRDRTATMPRKAFLSLPVNGDTLEAWMIRPAAMDSTKRYPLLLYVYGGPGNQEVLDQWGGSQDAWFAYLAEQGYVVACVDNSGSGGKGAAFERSVFLQLGKREVSDQAAAATYLGRLPFIDSTRIGIYGASYGGYIAAACLLYGNGVFKAGIAQSPVTDWRLYDNVYTERYMHTPETNPEGYAQYSPVHDAHLLRGRLLLIHGLSDDNVHFQHSLEFIRALNASHAEYDLCLYPDNAHGISGGETRYDLFLRITRFLLENL